MSSQDEVRAVKRIKTSGTSAAAASAFFLKASEKPKSLLSWSTRHETLLVAKYDAANLVHCKKTEEGKEVKVAAFDLDGTLINTVHGGRFPKDATDWRFFDPEVTRKLRKLHESDHLVVIFSNQAAIKMSDSSKRLATFKTKIEAITRQINIPLLLFAATGHDLYRKPRIGMFSELSRELEREGKEVQLDESFFVGDAAGRLSEGNGQDTGKDFAASDRKFAINAGLTFHTPEEYFRNKPVRSHELDGFDPRQFTNPESTDYLFERLAPLELVLFVGSPAAGKSSFFKRFMAPLQYVRINQDTLKTRQRCIAKATEELLSGNSVAIDNTNANIGTRASYVQLAKEIPNVVVRVVHFTAETALCEHNNGVRAFSPREDEEKREILPTLAFTSYRSRYQEPTLAEGFLKIEQVDFVWTGTREQQRIWRMFWV